MEKNGTPASPATALLRSVLPVPGGPTMSTPFGMCAPRARKRSGYLRNSTTSWSSALDSSTPATSVKVTVGRLPVNMRARLRPKPSVWLFVPCAWRIMNRRIAPKKMSGRNWSRMPKMAPMLLERVTSIWIPIAAGLIPADCRMSKTLVPGSLVAVSGWLGFCRGVAMSRSPSTTILVICPFSA